VKIVKMTPCVVLLVNETDPSLLEKDFDCKCFRITSVAKNSFHGCPPFLIHSGAIPGQVTISTAILVFYPHAELQKHKNSTLA
jgi:hypothetical protein